MGSRTKSPLCSYRRQRTLLLLALLEVVAAKRVGTKNLWVQGAIYGIFFWFHYPRVKSFWLHLEKMRYNSGISIILWANAGSEKIPEVEERFWGRAGGWREWNRTTPSAALAKKKSILSPGLSRRQFYHQEIYTVIMIDTKWRIHILI